LCSRRQARAATATAVILRATSSCSYGSEPGGAPLLMGLGRLGKEDEMIECGVHVQLFQHKKHKRTAV
jgi:hypothetical protein